MSETPFGNPEGPDQAPPAINNAKSIVDNILDLDALLSADVRLAEKSARFSTKPDIEAQMEDLNAELESLVDTQGRSKSTVDQDMAGGVRSAHAVALEIEALEAEYAKSMRTVRLRQMDSDDWDAFQTRWRSALSENPPYPVEFYEELVVRSATQPKFTAEQLRAFRKKVGHPAFNEIAQAAWAVNTSSGVSLPKSSLSSAVLRHTGRD